jgi:hypothetical protein
MVLVDKPRRRVFHGRARAAPFTHASARRLKTRIFRYAANRMRSFLCSSNNVMFK